MKAALPENEAIRLALLREYNILDTMPEQVFDDLTLLAAQICQTPIALISLIDEDRQWFKSRVGFNATETSRDVAFCAHAILNAETVMEVRDAQLDPRFADNPLVTADPHIRFYAGAPLVAPDGLALGTLCVVDYVPRELKSEQKAALSALSRMVVAQLDLRRAAIRREDEKLSHQSDLTVKNIWSLANTTLATFGLAVLALLIVGGISLRSLLDLGRQMDAVQHSHQVIEQAERVMTNMLDVQSGQRGYIITGSDEFLDAYGEARISAKQTVQELRRITMDNPVHLQDINELELQVERRLKIAQKLIEIRRTQGFKAAQKSVALGVGKAVMDQIRRVQHSIESEEQRQLVEHSRHKQDSIRFTLLSVGVFGGLAIFVVGFAGVRIRREIMQRSAERSRIELLNADLEARALELAAARHRAEASDRFKSAMFDYAGHAIISSTPSGIVTSFNKSAERMLGYSAVEMVGIQTPAIFHDAAEISQRAKEFSAELGVTIEPGFEVFVVKSRRNLPNEYEWTYIRKDGTRLPVLLSVTALRDATNEITGFLGIAVDITERKRMETVLRDNEVQLHLAIEELQRREETIMRLALHDELTGLPNRRLFYDRLTMAISEARRHGKRVAVVFVDLDFFKQINDTLGHEMGDKFLVAIAQKIKAVPREEDTCARLGGDEFALILSNVADKDQVRQVTQRILDSLSGELVIDENYLRASASIGVAIFPDDADDATTLLKHADMAMYQSKGDGRNTYRFWDEKLVAMQTANKIAE